MVKNAADNTFSEQLLCKKLLSVGIYTVKKSVHSTPKSVHSTPKSVQTKSQYTHHFLCAQHTSSERVHIKKVCSHFNKCEEHTNISSATYALVWITTD